MKPLRSKASGRGVCRILSRLAAWAIPLTVGLSVLLVVSWNAGHSFDIYTVMVDTDHERSATPSPSSSSPLQGQQQQQQQQQQPSRRKHLLAGLIRSFPVAATKSSDVVYHHDPTQRRVCISLTAVPDEILALEAKLKEILQSDLYKDTFDCVHLAIPERSMRFSKQTYPSTKTLLSKFKFDPRIIIHRLFDYGPMTRYIASVNYEQHPDTVIVSFDIDANVFQPDANLNALVYASQHVDDAAIWCNQGEDWKMDTRTRKVQPHWDTYPKVKSSDNVIWNRVFSCRAVNGILIKPKHFQDFWYNQTEYDESCFWDDDRWVAFQMDQQGFLMKAINSDKGRFDEPPKLPSQPGRRRLGSLSFVNMALNSDQACIESWMVRHPTAFSLGRI